MLYSKWIYFFRLIAYLQGTATAAGIVTPAGFELGGFPAAAKFLQQQQQMLLPQEQQQPASSDTQSDSWELQQMFIKQEY